MSLSLSAWLVSAMAILLTGVAKGGFAGVFGGIAVPQMSLVMPPEAAAALTLPLLYSALTCLPASSGRPMV
ncbi:hypothetical protein [Vogesella oryzae]|uniref:hypothetical protein n=1 Tax=Vogesella oryzae TaxID=1735285 RepID=UPI0015837A06|nr:hypothetical protein [Vogesella oryzae]